MERGAAFLNAQHPPDSEMWSSGVVWFLRSGWPGDGPGPRAEGGAEKACRVLIRIGSRGWQQRPKVVRRKT